MKSTSSGHWFRKLSMMAMLGGLALVSTTCSDDFDDLASDECRLHPEDCKGGAGAFCGDDRDCDGQLFCCEDDKNCGGGMCTADCREDRDCPVGMLCEHDMCFYACDDDRDCAEDMTCEHGNTICEYP